jgi:glycosyltransferase involved in cell wall biosynthesis
MPLDLKNAVSAIQGSSQTVGYSQSTTRPINLLAYVHLRNIHGSTGAGRVARQLVEHLNQRQDISLQILADKSDSQRVLPLVGEPWQSFPYKLFTADTTRQQASWFAFESPKAESFWPEADIVFCTGESYVPVKKARLVVTAHDAAYFEQGAHQQGSSYWRQRFKWQLLFKRLASRVDMIHTVSQFSADRLSHFFPALSARIRVVPNAVTPQFFGSVSIEGTRFLSAHGLENHPFILIPGGLSFRKNAELIMTALPNLLSLHPDLKVVVSGHSAPAYAAKARQFSRNIELLGFVPDAVLHALYSGAHAVWFPSLYEGFGMPVLEAMACGTPVVASNGSSVPEIAQNAALLADSQHPDEQVDFLSALIGDSSLRDRMRQLGIARSSQFTWSKSASILTNHFKAML